MTKCNKCKGSGANTDKNWKSPRCQKCNGLGRVETRSDIMKSLGLTKTKGALGGTYYE